MLSSTQPSRRKIEVSAIIIPQVTCDLPFHPIPFRASWNHLSDIPLADPNFGQPGRIDLLLGVDMYVQVLLHGRRSGAPNAPVAFETELGWVLAGSTGANSPAAHIATHHITHSSTDVLIRMFGKPRRVPMGRHHRRLKSALLLNISTQTTRGMKMAGSWFLCLENLMHNYWENPTP